MIISLVTITTNTGSMSEWYYVAVSVTLPPESSRIIENVDLISWKTIVLGALNQMYGAVGQLSPFDILHHDGATAIVRCQVADAERMKTALLLHTVPVALLVGGAPDAFDHSEAPLAVTGSSRYLGVAARGVRDDV